MLRVIEFFAGIGCVHEAFEQSGLGFEIVARAEISERKNVCYEALWGDVPNLGDVTKIADIPAADFWHFSSPCQDLSVAGKHAGIHGERSGLCWTMLELARIHRPLSKSRRKNLRSALNPLHGHNARQQITPLNPFYRLCPKEKRFNFNALKFFKSFLVPLYKNP